MGLMGPLLLTLAALAVTVFLLRRRRQPSSKTSKPLASSGTLSELMKNGHRILDWTTELLSSSQTGTVTTFMGVVTANPSNVEHILKSHFPNYPKGSHSTTILSDFLGAGIFNSDGEHWRLQRKTASLEFTTKSIRSFVSSNVRLETSSRLLPVLHSFARSGQIVDLQDLFDCLAFDNVCQVTFGYDPARLDSSGDPDSVAFSRAFDRATALSVRRFSHPFPFTWKLLRFLNAGYERELKAEVAKVHRFAMQVVRRRKKDGDLGDDLLSRFIAEADYSDEFLRDIIISFVLAGRDTTSATLTWFFWLIASRPEVKARVLDEIRAAREQERERTGTATSEAVLTLDQVRGMDYLHAALSETLRLYPPVPLQTRACAEDDLLPDGTPVKKGSTVMYSAYAMGRSESIWGEDWKEFRPERWLENGVFRPASSFRFPVFHAGPRMCLGKDMAYIQMKAVAAAVMERFELEVVDEEKPREPEFTMILRMKGGLPVRIREKEF
ncbi:hypothetical protein J5N97_024683 [Dioscorea zingiberensis]|uniref:Cytochrome P450 n=1 Tax=Dioscorea zingiberensis TaxID=325984 RepID=A0A9D5C6Y4_9LILI|nr:hypothetical protein J5N97_024683 [Dioscorea zingiberensis]